MKKFISQTPRWVSLIQTFLLSITSITGTLAAAGVVINPAIGVAVAVATSVTAGALQFTEKVGEIEK